jgi:hypothetical protein
MRRSLSLTLCAAAALAVAAPTAPPVQSAVADKPDEAAVKRTRKLVHILDDVYKQGIVLITDKYVNTKKDYPAGRAAIKWFAEISKNGSHEVRLIDVSGEPLNPDNVAKDAFEKEGVKQLKGGKDYFDQVTDRNGKPYLRAIAAIPVVMDKCVMCHPNYKDAKKGQAIGALTYAVPID